jgi:ParB family chromosome partitioning protein
MHTPETDLPSAQIISVPLSRIDTTDETYRITTRTDVDDLLASIGADGLLNPPFLTDSGARFTVVSGFRRIAACTNLGMEDIKARILNPNLSPLDCLRIAIADNALQRPLNLLETSRALHKLSLHLHSDRRLVESTSSLGLPSNPSVVKKIKDLCLLPDKLQRAILDDSISLSMAMELKNLPSTCAAAFAQLFGEFKLSLSKQREIVTLVKEIARREEISELTLLEGRPFQDIIADREGDRGQIAREIRDYLRQRRFPQIVKAEVEFENQRKKLKLGSDMKLIAPKNFEGTNYALNLTFNSITHLEELNARLDHLVKHPGLKHIVEGKDTSDS